MSRTTLLATPAHPLRKDALDRMDQGRYGECQDCGETIDAARLDAVPWTTHCLGCQDRAEKLKLRLHA
jgi:DnaK suppressor protein